MALSISVRRGSKIDVGGKTMLVQSVPDQQEIIVSVDGGPDVSLTTTQRVEVVPGVFASCGKADGTPFHHGLSRIAFEAPRTIRIKIKRDSHDANGTGNPTSKPDV